MPKRPHGLMTELHQFHEHTMRFFPKREPVSSEQMEIRYHSQGLTDFNEVVDYIAEYSPDKALLFVDEYQSSLELASANPRRGRALERQDIRSMEIRRFPYRVFYQIQDYGIKVLSVSHTARRPGHWRERVE